ncbi:MAG TPA: DUF3788 family protein [Ignavibacteriaceae bacterium]|nr:DUF3788 family protein [Ignavibacteriaceae bacterium]
METINNLELRDENQYPSDDTLREILNESFQSYKKLLELYAAYDLNYEWRYYHDGKAWLCKVQKKKKTIVWMSAWKGYMQAALYFAEKYINQVYDLDISEEMKENFRSTKNVGKSKPFIFMIREESILKDFETVMKYKLGCR